MRSFVLVLRWYDMLISIQRLENNGQMMEKAISPDFVASPWQHWGSDRNFKHIPMVCNIISISCKKIINSIRIWDFFYGLSVLLKQ